MRHKDFPVFVEQSDIEDDPSVKPSGVHIFILAIWALIVIAVSTAAVKAGVG